VSLVFWEDSLLQDFFCQFCSVSWDKFLKIWSCTVDDDADDIDMEASIKSRRTIKGKESKPTTRVSSL